MGDGGVRHHVEVSGYEVLEQIGCGTYGNVYKVRARGEDGEVLVLKQVRLSGLSKREQEDSTKEAHLMLSIEDHENIVRHHVSFIESGHLNIVMEYCPGGDLARLIRETRDAGETFSEDFIWQVLVQVCQALHHLHTNRVLHRDVKPENVFLDANARVKVGDFGLGRLLGSQSKHANSMVGTPLYFSPELCKEDMYDERSDIWAFGCLVYQMAALRPPFLAKNPIALAQKIVKAQFKPLPAQYSSDLHFLVHRMLEKDPRSRPNTAQLLSYGPTKIHLMKDQMELWERQVGTAYREREAELYEVIESLEQKLDACEREMREMRTSHDRAMETAESRVRELEDRLARAQQGGQHAAAVSAAGGAPRTPVPRSRRQPAATTGRKARPRTRKPLAAVRTPQPAEEGDALAAYLEPTKPASRRKTQRAAGELPRGSPVKKGGAAAAVGGAAPRRNLFTTPLPAHRALGPARRVPTAFVLSDSES